MAMFHFRLKSDKKPNGAKVSAVKHVEYINREGYFARDDQSKLSDKFNGNFITTAQTPNALNGLNALLYKTDDFGSIKNTAQGFEVSENASHTTISIALMLADETMEHKPLVINGSPEFRKKVMEATLRANLPISFQDKIMQKDFLRQKGRIENERKNFVAAGGRIITKRPNIKPHTAPTHAQSIEVATKIGFRLPTLSERTLVYSKSSGTDMLLQNDESNGMDELAKECYQHVRWDFSDERTRLARLTAKKILENIAEATAEQSALSHVEYINREKAFAQRGDCIFHSHHLPKWAHDDPKNFFQAADEYEGVGNRRYREIEFALPNELTTVEQYRQIIDAFIAKHLNDHYYAYAIHNKIGMMSDGQHHPHVHIMFSERLIDDVEKIKERDSKAFFLYPARKKKDGSQPSFVEKWNRGAPKDRKWADKNFLPVLRADFAQIQNEVLERNGFSIRVDHRSLKAQKEEANRNGDTFLARLFSRIPEEYIGVISCKDDDNDQLKRLERFRSLRKQHFDLVMKLDSLSKQADELKTKDSAHASSYNAKKFTDSPEFTSQKFISQYQQELRAKMFTAIAEVNKWKRVIISQHDAEEHAKLEYMTKAERALWQKYFETLTQKKHLEDFLQTLRKPDERHKEALQAYNNLVAGVQVKIFSLGNSSLAMKKSVEEIQHRLESPEFKNNIALVIHQILQGNIHARKMLKQASDNLDKAVDELRNSLFNQEMAEPKNIFTTREVYKIIRQHYHSLKREYERTLDAKVAIRRQIISPQRAFAMAKNIFVHGDFKRLRESIRQHKKDEQRLAQKFLAFYQRENIFLRRDWTSDNRSSFLQEKYFLIKQKTLLVLEKSRLALLSLALQRKQDELESLCQLPDSVKKIEEIAAGILRKNYKSVRQLEEIETCAKQLALRLHHAKKQIDCLKQQLSSEQHTTYYKVSSDCGALHSLASLIADAILRDPQAVQLVALSDDDCLEMKKDWELMSELDKDALVRKKIIREL